MFMNEVQLNVKQHQYNINIKRITANKQQQKSIIKNQHVLGSTQTLIHTHTHSLCTSQYFMIIVVFLLCDELDCVTQSQCAFLQ